MLTIMAIVDEVDGTVGSTRLMGNKHMPKAVVAGILEYALQQDRGYTHPATLANEGYEFCPAGPEWHDEVHGMREDACWTWDWQRTEDDEQGRDYPHTD